MRTRAQAQRRELEERAIVLKHGLDQQIQVPDQRVLDLPEHENVRGAAYYQTCLHLH